MDTTLSEKLLSLIISFENLLEGGNKEKFDIKHKVLYLLKHKQTATPSYLIETLGIARSNLAIICNNLAKQGAILKTKDATNKKEIFYSLTDLGNQILNEKLENAETRLTKIRNKTKIIKLSKELSKLI